MKLRKLNILLLLPALVLLLSLGSCVDDYLYNSVKEGLKPGTPVELSFGLQIPEGEDAIMGGSRASTDTETDRVVYDLYLFIFNEETQQLKTKYFFPQISNTGQNPCDPAYSSTGSAIVERDADGRRIIKRVHTTAGPSKIVGVANCNRKGSAMILEKLNKVSTVEELREVMVSTIDPQSKQPDFEQSLTVMSGYYYPGTDATAHVTTPCDFEADNEVKSKKGYVNIDAEVLPGILWLTPLQSRVKFVVMSEGPAEKDGIPAGQFVMESWQVYNLPARTPLFCHGYGDGKDALEPQSVNSLAITRFDSDDELTFTDAEKTALKDDKYTGIFGFNFFTADNHPGRGSENIKSYGDRAQWVGEDYTSPTLPHQKQYINAPAGATYVVIRGTYSGGSYVTEAGSTEPVLKNVTGDVTYTVFLGHNSGSGANADNRDFDTYRNFNYTYLIRVKGVDKITVEVNKDQEDRPDAEGNIITATTSTETLDAHYEQRVMHVTKQNILDAINSDNFLVSVTVPMFKVSRRIYKYDNNKPDADPNKALPYMQWLEFYEHKTGEENRKYIHYTDARGNGTTKNTMDIKQFMARLYQYAHDESAPDEMTFTVYFDEYIYEEDPGTGTPITWLDMMRDGQPRRMTMLGTTKFSTDHNSSYTNSGTTYVQRAMQTIYDVDMDGIERGWATEVIEEDLFAADQPYIPYGTFTAHPGYQYNKNKHPESKYGRQNTWRVNCGPGEDLWDWKKLINNEGYLTRPAAPNSNNANETNLFSTCMQRNRDLNGNGKIDREELLWYMPSMEQMQLLYMGYGALTDDVMLYNPQEERKNGNVDSKNYKLRHYVTSSFNKKLWAEEGLSISALGIEGNTPATKPGGWNYDAKLYVRCIRTLGTHNFQHKDVPWYIDLVPEAQYQSIYEYTPYPRIEDENDTYRPYKYEDHKLGLITMRYLNPKSLINVPRLTETMGRVHTFSETNFPTYQFEVADTIIAITGEHITPHENDKKVIESVFDLLRTEPNYSPCDALGDGWRMPTITELAMIEWAWDANWQNLFKQDYPGYANEGANTQNDKLYKWRELTGYDAAILMTRTEYYYKQLGLEPPSGTVRTYHVYDNDFNVSKSAQFSLIKTTDQANATNKNRIPTIRCVRSYTKANASAPTPKSARAASTATQRKLRKK